MEVEVDEDTPFRSDALTIWNSERETAIAYIPMSQQSPILALRVNQHRIIAVQENEIHIIEMGDSYNTLFSIDISPSTVKMDLNKVALSNSKDEDKCFLVFSDSTSEGNCLLYDAYTMNPVN
jgi:hypothetical protein